MWQTSSSRPEPLNFRFRKPHAPPSLNPSLRLVYCCTMPQRPRIGAGGAPAYASAAPATRTKLIVRRLPPVLTLDAFLAELASKLGCAETQPQCDGHLCWLRYLQGRPGPKRPAPSMAYLAVRLETQLQEVAAAIHSLAFVSDKGVPYKPTVELAPYQRVPKPPGRRDAREGTLQQEPEYLAFVESLFAPAPPKPSTEAINAAAADSKRTLQGGGGEVYETPLMAFLKARSEARAKQRSAGKAARQKAKADSAQAAGGAQPRVKKGAKSGSRSNSAVAGADGGDAGGRGERGVRSKGMKTTKGERTAGPSTHVVISPSAAGVVSSGSSYAAAAAAMAGYAATAAAMQSAAPSTLPAPKVLSRPASNSSLHSGGGGGGGPAAHSNKVPAPNAAPAIEVFLGSGAQGGGKSRGRGRSGGGRGGGRGS